MSQLLAFHHSCHCIIRSGKDLYKLKENGSDDSLCDLRVKGFPTSLFGVISDNPVHKTTNFVVLNIQENTCRYLVKIFA